MRLGRILIHRFYSLLRRSQAEADLGREMEIHLEQLTREYRESGLSETEARLQARRTFGPVGVVQEQCRDQRRVRVVEELFRDIKYAVRRLRQSPVFTTAAVLSLALGIGAGTAIFSIADTILLRPLPYPHPGQLLWVGVRFPHMPTDFLASPDYVAWRRDNHVFEQLAATQAFGGETVLLNGANAQEVHAVRVSANFLKTFGTHPALGRDFTANEELPNGPKSLLLSHRLWRQRFQARPEVIGRTILLNGESYTVIGVLPASFVYPMDVPVDVMATLPVSPVASHRDRTMSIWAVYGRLAPGVNLTQARADLGRLLARSRADAPLMFRSDTQLVLQSLREHRVGEARRLLSLLLGAVACLLVIACANLSNLLLGRWMAREGEFALRAAIGAGRARLVWQNLTDAGLLTLLGSSLATVLVVVLLGCFSRYAAGELPRLSEITLDKRVFAIGLLVSVCTTLAFGVLPAWRTGSVDIQSVLQRSNRPGLAAGFRWAKRALIATEVALAFVLLSAASLLLETLWHLRNDHLGFAPEQVLSVSIPLTGTRLAGRNEDLLVSDLRQTLHTIPGVESVAFSECTPLSSGPLTATFSRVDRPLPESFHRGDNIHICGVGAGYARTSGLRMKQGRFFEEQDFDHPNTLAVINEITAHTYFPGENPLGKQIIGGPEHKWKTIIGVISDSKNAGLTAPPAAQAFVNGRTWPGTSVQLLVRSVGDVPGFQRSLADRLRAMDPGAIATIQPLPSAIAEMSAGPRFHGMLVASFAVIAFLTAFLGVYGVLAFAVRERTQEIGIRLALGAQRRQVMSLVFQEGSALVFIGTVAGLGGSLGLTRYLETLLYGVRATDPRTYGAVAFSMMFAAALAIALPARRAASVDPLVTLRQN